mgnify:FL=1
MTNRNPLFYTGIINCSSFINLFFINVFLLCIVYSAAAGQTSFRPYTSPLVIPGQSRESRINQAFFDVFETLKIPRELRPDMKKRIANIAFLDPDDLYPTILRRLAHQQLDPYLVSNGYDPYRSKKVSPLRQFRELVTSFEDWSKNIEKSHPTSAQSRIQANPTFQGSIEQLIDNITFVCEQAFCETDDGNLRSYLCWSLLCRCYQIVLRLKAYKWFENWEQDVVNQEIELCQGKMVLIAKSRREFCEAYLLNQLRWPQQPVARIREWL